MQPSNPSIPAPVAAALKAWARSRKIAPFLLLDSVVAVERVTLRCDRARLRGRLRRVEVAHQLDAPAYRVSYRYRGTAGDLWIGAWDDRVLEPDREPWSAGTERLRWLRGMGAALGMLAAVFYLAQHPYLLMQPASLGGIAAGGAAGVALAGGLAGAGLPRGRRRARRLGTVAAAFLLSLLTVLAFAEASRPSLAKALERLENDRTSAALATLQACRDLGIEPREAAELHDRILEQRVLDAEDIAGAWKGVEAPFISPAARDRAERHALALSARRAAELQAQGAFLNSAQILSKVPLSLRGAEEIRPYFLALMQYRLLQCAEPADLACAQGARSKSPSIKLDEEEQARLHQAVFQTLKPGIDQAWKEMRSFQEIERRLEACRRLSTATELVERYAPMQAEALPIRSDPLAFRCADLVRAKLRHEQTRREAVVRRERAARASWASAPLLCRDGTLSPTCVCGQASRRGCCSHHGGVAGCSAP